MAAAGAGVEASSDAGEPAKPAPKRTVHRSRDGSTYVYDAAAGAWRLESAPSPEPTPGAAQAALPWAQFNVSFDGDFVVAGAPLLLGEKRSMRAEGEQVHGDTGRSVWDGAVALAKVLEQNPQLIAGRKALEVGAGRGVTGLSAARLGARHVVLTDLAYCLEALQEVVVLNGLDKDSCSSRCNEDLGQAGACDAGAGCRAVEVAELDWARPREFLDKRAAEETFDVVLAADVVWLMELVDPLARALGAICRHSPAAEVLVMHQTRASNVEVAFLEAMAAESFELAWELPGGGGGASTASAPSDSAASSAPAAAWHPDYVPDRRVKLWSFRLRPAGVGPPASA